MTSLRTSLFITCTADTLYPSTARAAVRVLEALGVRIDFPELQTCCGQPWQNTGHLDGARRLARRFLEVFEGADTVVALSSSCVDAVRNHYGELFQEAPDLQERLRALGSRTFEFCEYLERVACVRDLPKHPRPRTTTYHSSCRTLRGVGLRGVAERYLTQMLGDSFVPLSDAEVCCGFGGSFSVKLPEVSGRLMGDKLGRILETGASQVVSLDLSCMTHLAAGARRRGLDGIRFMHLAELMAEAFGGEGA